MRHLSKCNLCILDIFKTNMPSRIQETVYNSKLAFIFICILCVFVCACVYRCTLIAVG